MYRFLASKRWLVRTVAGVLLVLVCVRLGLWQLDRNDERAARNAVIEAGIDSAPVPIDELNAPGEPLDTDDQWRNAVITGQYDPEHELALRLRPVDGTPGVHALTPLVTADGDAFLVDRGFVASEGRPDDEVDLPDPPSGTVTVQVRLRAGEDGEGAAQRAGTVRRVDTAALAETLPYPLYGAWGERVEQDPPAADGLQAVPPPEAESGPHLSYAVQWFIFAVMGVGGFFLLIRAEARGRAEAEAEANVEASTSTGADARAPTGMQTGPDQNR